MDRPKISVIIPIYNVENYLADCLDSVARQTFRDLEVVMAKMEGDYVFFLDSDDILVENALEILWRVMEAEGSEIGIGSYVNFADPGHVWNQPTGPIKVDRLPPFQAIDRMDNWNDSHFRVFITAWGKLIRRDLLEGLSFPVGRYFEDEAFTYKVYLKADQISHINLAIYHYSQHPDSIMGARATDPAKKHYDFLLAYMEKYQTLKALGYETFRVESIYLKRLYSSRDYYDQFPGDMPDALGQDIAKYQQAFQGDLVCLTLSAEIEHLAYLVQALPDLCFHIGARTFMVDSLLSYHAYPNVILYPAMDVADVPATIQGKDIYLDINHLAEVPGSLEAARDYKVPVLAFDTTAHHPEALPQDCIIPSDQLENMVDRIRALLAQKGA